MDERASKNGSIRFNNNKIVYTFIIIIIVLIMVPCLLQCI